MNSQSTVTDQETVIHAMHDAFHRRDFQAGTELFAPIFSNRGVQLPREAIIAVWTDICTRSPDARLGIVTLSAGGEWVSVRNVYSGTHQGVGRLPVEHHACRDDIEMMAQLGLPLQIVPGSGTVGPAVDDADASV